MRTAQLPQMFALAALAAGLAGCPWIAPSDFSVARGPAGADGTETPDPDAGSVDGGGGGGGTVASEPVDAPFDVGPFTAISNRAAFDVAVSDGARSVTVSCPPALLAALSVTMVQGELRIDVVDGAPDDGWQACAGVVQAPTLVSAETLGLGDLDLAGTWQDLAFLTTGGSGAIAVDGIEGAELHVETVASGDVTVGGGSTELLTVLVGGSGDTTTADLVATDGIIESDGSGTAEVRIQRSAAIGIFGSGDVIVWGTPSMTVTYQGSGDLILK